MKQNYAKCTLAMLLWLMAVCVPLQMHADNVYYLNEEGTSTSAENVTIYSSDIPETLTAGTYALDGTAKCSKRLQIEGKVTLILLDGCEVEFQKGIHVYYDSDTETENTLNITAGSVNETIQQTGKLTAGANEATKAGIGSNQNETYGAINIWGGNITAYCLNSSDQAFGAGIGGGRYGGKGSITIQRGNVTAYSNMGTGEGAAAAIGAGDGDLAARAAGKIQIDGGTVKAYCSKDGTNSAPGIGRGANGESAQSSESSTVVINPGDEGETVVETKGSEAIFVGTATTGYENAAGAKFHTRVQSGSSETRTTKKISGLTGFDLQGDIVNLSNKDTLYAKIDFIRSLEDGVYYLDAEGEAQLLEKTDFKVLKETDSLLTEKYYVLNCGEDATTLTNEKRLMVKGNVTLILLDADTLYAPKGICVEGSNSLTITAGNTAPNIEQTGSLFIRMTGNTNFAGIGAGHANEGGETWHAAAVGTIIINGGYIESSAYYFETVEEEGDDDETEVYQCYAAGIGGCGLPEDEVGDKRFNGGKITVNDGVVMAFCIYNVSKNDIKLQPYGAGIGVGTYSDSIDIVINGGQVNVAAANGKGEIYEENKNIYGISAGDHGSVLITGGGKHKIFASALNPDLHRAGIRCHFLKVVNEYGSKPTITFVGGSTDGDPVVADSAVVISMDDDTHARVTAQSKNKWDKETGLHQTTTITGPKVDLLRLNEDTCVTSNYRLYEIDWVEPDQTYYYRDTTGHIESVVCFALTDNMTDTLKSRFYAIDGEVTFDKKRIVIDGDVTLIALDGATFESDYGITVNKGNSLALTVGGETEDFTGENAQFFVYSDSPYDAAIGGSDGNDAGKIYLNGGTVEASMQTDTTYGAAIGGGRFGDGGEITLYGVERVSANSDATTSYGAGIGGGYGGNAGIIKLKDYGRVVAKSTEPIEKSKIKGAGIGDGANADKGNSVVTITSLAASEFHSRRPEIEVLGAYAINADAIDVVQRTTDKDGGDAKADLQVNVFFNDTVMTNSDIAVSCPYYSLKYSTGFINDGDLYELGIDEFPYAYINFSPVTTANYIDDNNETVENATVVSLDTLMLHPKYKNFSKLKAKYPVSVYAIGDGGYDNDNADADGYFAAGDMTDSVRIYVNGSARLIIKNDSTFTALKGFNVEKGNKLIVTTGWVENGENEEAEATKPSSSLVASADSYDAAIGGDADGDAGEFVVNGNVSVHATGIYGAAIGGGFAKANDNGGAAGNTIVNNGYIIALSEKSAAIGSGANNSGTLADASGSMIVNGNTSYVIAKSLKQALQVDSIFAKAKAKAKTDTVGAADYGYYTKSDPTVEKTMLDFNLDVNRFYDPKYTYTKIYFTPGTPLFELVENGEQDKEYLLANTDLLCVRTATDKIEEEDYTYLFCKDDNKHANPNVKEDNEIDYMRDYVHKQKKDWDQSNWVMIKVKDADKDYAGCYIATAKGTYTNTVNPTFEVASPDDITLLDETGEYKPNTMSMPNFFGTQPSNVNKEIYFFVDPKPMEVVNVIWAMWDDYGYLVVPDYDDEKGINIFNLQGQAPVNMMFIGNSNWEDGKYYEMPALIMLYENANSAISSNGPRRAAPTGGYVIYPLELEEYTTSVNEQVENKEVASIKFVNIAGMQSDKPFDGVNIVVITYTDGTTATSKVVR